MGSVVVPRSHQVDSKHKLLTSCTKCEMKGVQVGIHQQASICLT